VSAFQGVKEERQSRREPKMDTRMEHPSVAWAHGQEVEIFSRGERHRQRERTHVLVEACGKKKGHSSPRSAVSGRRKEQCRLGKNDRTEARNDS